MKMPHFISLLSEHCVFDVNTRRPSKEWVFSSRVSHRRSESEKHSPQRKEENRVCTVWMACNLGFEWHIISLGVFQVPAKNVKH